MGGTPTSAARASNEPPQAWPAEWLRGALELCTLGVISRGPTYGYQITADLAAAGLGTIKGGTLYPLLARLEEAGLVSVEWRPSESGPARKYYSLSPAGRSRFEERRHQWVLFAEVVDGAIGAASAASVRSTK